MTPNLVAPVLKAVRPWEWFKSNPNNNQRLYVSKEPVPVIYAITANKRRYLVALKPDAKDTEHIFQPTNSKSENFPKQDYTLSPVSVVIAQP